MSYPAAALPPDESIQGSGIYTLHYVGGFAAYAGMDEHEPIYVGRANPPGGRHGRVAATRPSQALNRRLAKHVNSIKAVDNLSIRDFRCRWLVLDPVWISLTEQVLISEYQPIWNVVVEGFGINAPGRGRGNQARSQWDTLHPGRPEVANLPERKESAAIILEGISTHRNLKKR